MLGAICGDVIGSVHEFIATKRKDFKLLTPVSTYTDDTVLTVAVADAILNRKDYGPTIKAYARRSPMRGYGGRFMCWMLKPGAEPYNSFGNGSAMRVGPVGFAFNTEAEVLKHAELSAVCSHNHPEGIKGAQAVALAIWLARQGTAKETIRTEISRRFGYDLARTVDQIRPGYKFNETCQKSVPEAIIAFLDSTDFEDAIRSAVSLGGDADTQGAIAGSIAEAFYGTIPETILKPVWKKLPAGYRSVIREFYQRYGLKPIIPD